MGQAMLRLGYACVNTQLPSAARTTRLANATPERLLELTEANLEALAAILRWNREHDIAVFRISSGTVPFGGHPVNELAWEEALAWRFAEVAALLDGVQVSTHPGQFVVLGAPAPELVDAALADVEYHARLLRALGLGRTHGIVIHAGGVYGDRDGAAVRFARAVELLSDDARQRLRIENDERWSIAEVLALGRTVEAPVVVDAFHHELNPSLPGVPLRELVLQARTGWRGPQEVHFSTQDPGKRPGAHARTLDAAAFERFACAVDGIALDCILEVKDKERSVLAARALLDAAAH